MALVAATVLLAVGPGTTVLGLVAVAGSVLVFGVGLAVARRPGSRAAFLSVIVVAALDIGLLLLRGASLA